MVIKGYRVQTLLKATGREVLEDNVLGLSAQTAYFFFFSLFPLFLFLAPLLSVLGEKQELFTWLMRRLEQVVPAEAFAIVRGVVEDVVFSAGAPGLISVGALLALWAGSNVFNALIEALNRAYDVDESRPWWKKRLIAIAAVIGAGVVLIAASTVMMAGEQIVGAAANAVGLSEAGQRIWLVLQYPLVLAMLVGLAWLLYQYLPNVRQDRTQTLVGAVVATALWVLVTLAFRFYVQNFGNYNKTYGTIGGVIVLLMWMYLSMLVLLVGGELNSELHHGTGAVEPRRGETFSGRVSTGAGPERPSNEQIVRTPGAEASSGG